MIKRIFIILSILGLASYLIVAIAILSPDSPEQICIGVDYCIKESVRAKFIHEKELKEILNKHNLVPTNKKLSHIDLKRMEKTLLEHPYIEQAQCYKTRAGVVRIMIEQQIPLIHVLSSKGESYYIDIVGRKMPKTELSANVVVATGQITSEYAQNRLLEIGHVLYEDSFWRDQIQQIHVLKNGEVELAPRVGNHIIAIGEPEDITQKLNRLRRFYDTLNEIGWNKYARINIEFDNQIICTKNETIWQ